MTQKVTAPTFIVHGPMGCGKTFNRRLIAERLTGDPEAFVDEWDYRDVLQDGKVHLLVPPPTSAQAVIFGDLGVRIMPFAALDFIGRGATAP